MGNGWFYLPHCTFQTFAQTECTYCAFRAKNKDIVRRVLTQDEITHETEALIKQGHKRVIDGRRRILPQSRISVCIRLNTNSI